MLQAELNRLKARVFANGCSVEPYTDGDLKKFDSDDLKRISEAMLSPSTQVVEGRYFCSEPWIRAQIGLMVSRYRVTSKYIKTWKDAEKQGCLDEYFAGIDSWPLKEKGAFIQYSGDILEYYRERGIASWEQARDNNCLAEYFSGVGIFPVVGRRYKLMTVANDYEEYIKSMTYDQYLELLRNNSAHEPARNESYNNATTFYQTAMTQIGEYVKIIKDMNGKIYIPGDGIGIGSYVARMLGKDYYSSEPNNIGREAILMGVISAKEKYDHSKAKLCDSVFFGNCYSYCIDEKMYEELSDKEVIIYDEQPPLFQSMYPKEHYKCWTNIPHSKEHMRDFPGQIALTTYSKENDLVSMDKLSGVLIRYASEASGVPYLIKSNEGDAYVASYTMKSWKEIAREEYKLISERQVMEINNNLIKMLDPSKNYGCEVVNKAKGLYHQARNLEEKLSYDSRFRDFFSVSTIYVISGPVARVPKNRSIYHIFRKSFF